MHHDMPGSVSHCSSWDRDGQPCIVTDVSVHLNLVHRCVDNKGIISAFHILCLCGRRRVLALNGNRKTLQHKGGVYVLGVCPLLRAHTVLQLSFGICRG